MNVNFSRKWLCWAVLLVVGLGLGACRVEPPAKPPAAPTVVKHYGKAPLTLTLTLDREKLSVAEQLTVELRAETGEEFAVKFGETPKFSGLAVVSATESAPGLAGAGRIAVSKRFVLDPQAPGKATIPAMSVDAWKKAEHEATPVTVSTEPLTVEVTSLLAKDDPGEQISDIAPPLATPVSPWLWGGIALACAVLLLAGWLVWRRYGNRVIVPPPPLPPHLIAYQALDRLVKGGLLVEGRIADFYQVLSGILRQYIEQRFGLRAPERTTEEFLAELGMAGGRAIADPAHRMLLRDFLTQCDLVKFARHTPAVADAEASVELCRRFVRETEPSPAEAATGGTVR